MDTTDLTRAMLEGERAGDLPGLDVAHVRSLGLRRRRRHRRTVAVTVVAVVAVVVAVLVTIPSLVNRADSPSPVKPDGLTTQPPARGTCWQVDPRRLVRGYVHDDSPRVPCSRPHTLETVITYDLDKPTIANAEPLASLCLNEARVYVGSDLGHWVPWLATMFLPSQAQIAHGASWVRCDVAIGSRTVPDPTTIAPRTGSVKHAVTDHPAQVWACTNQPVRSGAGETTPLSDCRKPHLYEATGNLMLLEHVTKYPPPNQLRDAETLCVRSLTSQQRNQGLAVKTVWLSPAELRARGDQELSGICWRYRTDGGTLPAMH